jgi:hypothetical protein
MFFFMLIVVVFLGVISMEGICGGSGGATAYAKPEQRTARTGLMAAGLAFLMLGLGIGVAGLAFLLQSK